MSYLVNKLIEKVAIGPVRSFTKNPKIESWGASVDPSKVKTILSSKRFLGVDPIAIGTKGKHLAADPKIRKSGIIFGNISETSLPWGKQSNVERHELTHWLRGKKGKWSSRHYGKSNPLAVMIEEMAAYRRAGENLPRAIQGAAVTVAQKRNYSRLFRLMKAIK